MIDWIFDRPAWHFLALLLGPFVYAFVYFFYVASREFIRRALAWRKRIKMDKEWEEQMMASTRYKELKLMYLNMGHRGVKAHDLAMRKLHRKAVRKVR